MKEIFESLKLSAAGKPKEYSMPVAPNHVAWVGDLLCSYVVENGLVKQKVLTVSHKDKGTFKVPEELQTSVESVFGSPSAVFERSYPNRGRCIQYVFATK